MRTLNNKPATAFNPQFRILFCIVLFEFITFIFSGVSFSFLYKDGFFSIGADPFAWLVYGLRIPQFVTENHWVGLCLDALAISLLLLMIRDPLNSLLARALIILLFIFYVSLAGYLTHRNYQFGFFVVFVPFIFKKDIQKYFAFQATRYFLFFFYFSAACLKIANNSLADPVHFSHMLSGQFTPYFLEGNTGIRTDLNLFLISHSTVSYSLYVASFMIELSTLIGFFTCRLDKWLAVFLISFHLMSWLIMDIAPLGQIAFISLLFLGKSFNLIRLKDAGLL